MKRTTYSALALLALAALMIAGPACEKSDSPEAKFGKAISAVNKDWTLYEIRKEGEQTVILVEVANTEKVPFKEAQKAGDALLKIDPTLKGYIEFKGQEVPMTLRRLELLPST